MQRHIRADQPNRSRAAYCRFRDCIRSIYERERENEKNLFILIGHSQGNFFVEGVALRLARMEGPKGAFVFRNRLGILSFASPTDYSTLSREGDFRAQRIKRFTRRDDGIQALHALGVLGGKVPWPRSEDRESLWPWGEVELTDNMALTKGFSSPLVDALAKGPSTPCTPATNPVCDHALYTPFMNSHLLENYVADPPFTRPGKPIHPDVARKLLLRQPVSPATGRALLTDIRTELMQLKQTLFQTAKNER